MEKNKKRVNKLKIITILGTRPEIIRLSRVIPKIDDYFNQIIVFTQQSYDYELSKIFFEELEIRKPDYLLNVKSNTLAGQIANILKQSEEVLIKENPDAVLILGDTNSALSAIIAKRLKIPIFHMEAGNRSFDQNVPEEINRKIVDHISDFNLAYTEHSRKYLIREGIDQDKIFVTGTPFAEIFDYFKLKIENSDILSQLKLKPKEFFLISTHREENVDNKENLTELFSAFNFLAEKYKLPIIISLHPRTKLRLPKIKIKLNSLIKLSKPFGYFEYNKLQKNALCVISDSGSIQEESSILDFPAIQIRVSSERPEAFDAGAIVLTGFNKDTIVNSVNMILKQKNKNEFSSIPQDYRDINVSLKVVRIIMSFASLKKYHS